MFEDLLVSEKDYVFTKYSRMYADTDQTVVLWKEEAKQNFFAKSPTFWTWTWNRHHWAYELIKDFVKSFPYKEKYYDMYEPLYKSIESNKASSFQDAVKAISFVCNNVAGLTVNNTMDFNPTTGYTAAPHIIYQEISHAVLGKLMGSSKLWTPSRFIVNEVKGCYNTRKEYLNDLKNIVSQNLDQLYTRKDYNNFRSHLVLELPPGYNTKTLKPAWWALFVKPEIDLTEIFS